MRLTPFKTALLLLCGAVLLWVLSYPQSGECAITYKTQTVRGASLEGFINEGDEVRVAQGYYRCNPVMRGDVVIYADAGNEVPVIKIAKGVFGDTFSLALAEGGAKIFINGEALATTAGEVYRVSAEAYRLLSLYERDYQGAIPQRGLLILGNVPGGSRDSTEFGLVSVNDLIGRVVKVMPRE